MTESERLVLRKLDDERFSTSSGLCDGTGLSWRSVLYWLWITGLVEMKPDGIPSGWRRTTAGTVELLEAGG